MARYATPEDVRTMLDLQPAEWVDCRIQHLFKPLNVVTFADYGVQRATERCARCTTVKIVEMTLDGTVLTSRMRYPKGYLSEHGRIVGKAKGVVRVVRIQRSFPKKRAGKKDVVSGEAQRKLGKKGRGK